MRLTADTSRCIGSATCVLTDPSIFGQSEDDGTVVVYTEEVDAGRLDQVREAVIRCPSGALALVPAP